MRNPTRTDTHTHAASESGWIKQWCRGLTQGLRLVSSPPRLLVLPLLLSSLWKKKKRKNKPGVHLAFPPPMSLRGWRSEWERCGRGEVEERGNSQKGRRRRRHSWGVNRNNHSFLSALLDSGPKCPGGWVWPLKLETHHTQTHTCARTRAHTHTRQLQTHTAG